MQTAAAIAIAEAMLRQVERDIQGAATIGENGLPQDLLPFYVQGNIVRGAAVGKLWRSMGRQTLTLHPEVVEATAAATSSKFPMDILRTVPYMNPMVVFAEPPRLKSWRGDNNPERWANYSDGHMRLLGYFMYGKLDDARQAVGFNSGREAIAHILANTTSTHDPAAVGLGIVAIFDILDAAGRKIDTECSSFSVPLAGTYRLSELIQQQSNRFRFATDTIGGSERVAWMTEVFKIIFGTVLFLCSTTLDAERVPSSATTRLGKRTMARQPLSMYRVGWTIGAALSKYRRESQRQGESLLERQQDPQHRRAHFRMQWYGSRTAPPCQQMRNTCPCDGRHREWIFIAPYWTHVERLGQEGMNTVRFGRAD